MRSFGIFLIVMAVGSYVLPMIGMQFILVAWIHSWGPTVAWIIRGAMVAVGVGLIVAAGSGGGVGGKLRPSNSARDSVRP